MAVRTWFGRAHSGRATVPTRTASFLNPLGMQQVRRRTVGYAVAVIGTPTLVAGLLPFRDDITPLSKGFGFLVVVVVAAAIGGLGPGIWASVLGFATFNFFFIPPYGTFTIGSAENVVILLVFLGLSILISALLARATERAEAAEAREEEIRALQVLSAELVAAVPGPETYESVLTRLLHLFDYPAGALFVPDPTSRELLEQVAVGASPGELELRPDPGSGSRHPERIPLTVGGRVVGLLLLRSERPSLAPAESRVLRTFCDQFALVLERDRLLRAATQAEVYRQSDQVRRSLLAAVSHDLRSPLAAIKASVTDLLGDEAEHSPEQTGEALDSINQEADRLGSLVANLLDMSRIEAGMLKARLQTVDLAEIVSTCVDRALAYRPELTIRVRIANAALVRADPVFLDRIVTNLLDNASRAASDSGRHEIEMEARRLDDVTTIRIIDHGAGVPESAREQLFYPFYQVAERHPRLGTGLGLAIAKGFLSVMGGDIWVEDTAGGGATLAFSLPSGKE
jgi:two-component system, OmpR family, sensor histidine kinase KdpD